MPSVFCYKVYLPSTDTYEYFKELTNKELLVILKYNTNQDRAGLADYLEHLIKKKSYKDINFHRLDKFCILTTMLAVCVKNEIKLSANCDQSEKEYQLTVNLTDVLNVISNIKYSGDVKIIRNNNIQLDVNLPRNLYITEDTLTPVDMITTITVDGMVYEMNNFDTEQKEKILSSLPGSLIAEAIEYVTDTAKTDDSNQFFSMKSPYVEDAVPTAYNLNLINNTYMEFLIMIMGTGLLSFYQMVHGLTINNTLSVDHLMSVTPAEAQTYCDLIKDNIEARNKQAKEQSQQNTYNPTGG